MTYTGRVVDPLRLRPEDVSIQDVAHSLSNQCRFTGHVREFYSVAQHSTLCAEYVLNELDGGTRLALSALLHDGSETYLSDLARPIKNTGPLGSIYREVEGRVQKVVAEHFGLAYPFPDIILSVDETLLRAEQRALMTPWPADPSVCLGTPTGPIALNYPGYITGWTPPDAKYRFLAMYTFLTGIISTPMTGIISTPRGVRRGSSRTNRR
jgi:hypothetical protein